MCVCAASGRGGQEQQKGDKPYEKQLKDGNLLQPNPCKFEMAVEVCCHCQELSIVAKVCSLHQEFSIFVWF